MTISCNTVQERIAVGETLDEAGQRHVLGCPECSGVAADFVLLDARVAELSATVTVPDGFADRVMAHLDDAAPSTIDRLLGKRWVQLALAYAGAAVAIANVVRFVLSSLIPGASLGGIR
jgi:hypothetical protein